MPEWVQLRAGAITRTGLERGIWYLVAERPFDGTLRVVGPTASTVDIQAALVRIIAQEPESVTRVQETEFQPIRPGEPASPVTYYGVCPRGHWIRGLGAKDTDAHCPACSRPYRVEDEGAV
jgi:hypothetical protein